MVGRAYPSDRMCDVDVHGNVQPSPSPMCWGNLAGSLVLRQILCRYISMWSDASLTADFQSPTGRRGVERFNSLVLNRLDIRPYQIGLDGLCATYDAGTVSANIELASSSLDGPATDRFLHIKQDKATCGGRQWPPPPSLRASPQASVAGHNDTTALGQERSR